MVIQAPVMPLGISLCLLSALTLSLLPMVGVSISAEENGTLENMQVILIVLACVVPLYHAWKTVNPAARHLLLTTALLPFSFFFREVEIKDLDVPKWLIYVGSGLPNQLIVGALWLSVLISIFIVAESILHKWWRYLCHQPTGYLLFGCFVCLLGAGFVEKGDIAVANPLYVEESTELIGYCLLLLAACNANRAARKATSVTVL